MTTSITKPQAPQPPMVKLRADLFKALDTRSSTIGGVIDKRHIMIACAEIERNPALLQCSPQSIFASIVQAGAYGWAVGGVLGQAYLVPFKGEAQLIAGYKGKRDLIRRSQQADTTIEAVHEGDEFEYRGRFAEPRHVMSSDAQRHFKPLIGVYVVIYFSQSKSAKTFYWTKDQCIAHRDRWSVGWKRKPDEKNLWHENNPSFPVMCMKTVLHWVVNRGEAPVCLRDPVADRNILADPDEESTGEIIDAGFTPLESPHADAEEATPPPGAKFTEPNKSQLEEQEYAPKAAAAPPVEPVTATVEDPGSPCPDDIMASDALANEFVELLVKHTTNDEIRAWQAEVNMHGRLSKEHKTRLLKLGDDKLAAKKAKRGERSNGG
jgi:phage RecT family recombinase